MGFLNFRKTLTFIFAVTFSLSPQSSNAQDGDNYEYERSSLCMILIKHPMKQFNNEIQYVYSKMKLPERFYDHDLGVRIITFASNKDEIANIESFTKEVSLGRRLVAKWFDRQKTTGMMDMNLIRQRGLYNSTKGASNIARSQLRGKALLEDAGELLIDNTYLVVNDIVYVDKSVGWGIAKDIVNTATVFAPKTSGLQDLGKWEDPFENPKLKNFNKVINDLKGFKVKINSYLFRLKWNENISNQFYTEYYIDANDYNKQKAEAFNKENQLFTLEYVGNVENTQSNSTVKGTTSAEELIRKVCYRAVDKNLADLQHKFADFRIKAPLVSVNPIKAYIGLKEDVNKKSKYEVLERSIDNEGHVHYKRVGVIKPIEGKIWDNRYWATQEQTENSTLDATYFTKVSGGDFYPGMLIREIE